MPATVNGRRVVIVDGLRNPFAKAGTDLRCFDFDLSTAVVTELARSGLDPELVTGGARRRVQDVHASNIAREIVLATLPDTVDAYSVTRACATSTQATIDAAQGSPGDIDVAIVGGADRCPTPSRSRPVRGRDDGGPGGPGSPDTYEDLLPPAS